MQHLASPFVLRPLGTPAGPRWVLWQILLMLALGATAPAAVTFTFSSGFANDGVIPDGSLTGWSDTRTVSGIAPGLVISDLKVLLNLSGGVNSDFYAYLLHDTAFTVLLNRVGRTALNPLGYEDAGFGPTAGGEAFHFDALASHDVHAYQQFSYTLNLAGQLTGSWQPDGRNIHPLSSGATFDAASRDATLDAFLGLLPNGSWTLFLADVTSGGGEGRLQSWGLEITAVPEASPLAGAVLVALRVLAQVLRQRRGAKARSHTR